MEDISCKTCGKRSTGDINEETKKICPCRLAIYCDESCREDDWIFHKKVCTWYAARTPPVVKAVKLSGGNVLFRPVEVDIDDKHEVFRGKGHLSPISVLVGQPILVYRHLRDNPLNYVVHPHRKLYDNVAVTYLMMDPETGIAPDRWQQGIGTVTVARLDKSPLTRYDLEKLWMYCDRILDAFDDRCEPPRRYYDPAIYLKWSENYNKSKIQRPNSEHDEFDIPSQLEEQNVDG